MVRKGNIPEMYECPGIKRWYIQQQQHGAMERLDTLDLPYQFVFVTFIKSLISLSNNFTTCNIICQNSEDLRR